MPTENETVSEQESSPATAQAEAVEELLRQLVDARFVLTDRDGAVTRWSRPAEELFGWPAARMLGRPLVETLALAGELPSSAAWSRRSPGARTAPSSSSTLTFVPVGMSQSLEFNGFLEALEIAAPRGNALRQLQRSHKTVVDWVNARHAAATRSLDEDDLAAGTIVAFRPLIELPPGAAPAARRSRRAHATAAAAGQIADAVEAALGRSDDLERALEGTTAELEEARGEAEAARGEIAKAVERIARAGLGARRHSARARRDARAGREEERERTRGARRGDARARGAAGARARRHPAGAGAPERPARGDARERWPSCAPRARRSRRSTPSLAKERGAGDERRRLESELRDTRARVEQLEASARGGAPSRAGDEAALQTALSPSMRERVEALARELARVRRRGPERASWRSCAAGLAALEGAAPARRPRELREQLERTSARVEQLEQAVTSAGAADPT